jgi:hypothetical protein
MSEHVLTARANAVIVDLILCLLEVIENQPAIKTEDSITLTEREGEYVLSYL